MKLFHLKLCQQKTGQFSYINVARHTKICNIHVSKSNQKFVKATPDGHAEQARKMLPDGLDWQFDLAGTLESGINIALLFFPGATALFWTP